jgi:ribosome maturation protein SDO1
MRVRVIVPAADIDGLRERLLADVDKLEHEDTGDEWSGVGVDNTLLLRPKLTFPQTVLIDPGKFRVISELLNKTVKGKGRMETLTFNTNATTAS